MRQDCDETARALRNRGQNVRGSLIVRLMASFTTDLTAVQHAVLEACVLHADISFLNVTAEIWWRADLPFRGGRSTFAAHLRALEQNGMLERSRARAGYRLTPRGRRVADEWRAARAGVSA